MGETVTKYVKTRVEDCLADLGQRYPVLGEIRESIREAFLMMCDSFQEGGKTLICGNGGSATDAIHFSVELLKGFKKKRPVAREIQDGVENISKTSAPWINQLQTPLAVLPLTVNSGLLTAIGNDQEEELIFAQQVLAYGMWNDILMAISTSGNSANVIKAVLIAKVKKMHIIGLTGKSGGALRELCDICIRVPAQETPFIQELHLPVYHTLAAMLEEEFFGG